MVVISIGALTIHWRYFWHSNCTHEQFLVNLVLTKSCKSKELKFILVIGTVLYDISKSLLLAGSW